MKWRGRVAKYIEEHVEKNRPLHAVLIDPDRLHGTNRLERIISKLEYADTDLIFVGGSTGVGSNELDEIIRYIEKRLNKPIILFPGNISGISKYADAILFMSLLNSLNPYYIIGAQMQAAPIIARYGLEVLPTAYLIVGYGGTASHVGYAMPIPWEKHDLVIAYSLAAFYLGMRYIYLEAGSGAPRTVSPATVEKVRQYVPGLRIIVGGGIRTPEQAYTLASAGAHILVTGTLIEEDPEKAIKVIKAIKTAHIKYNI